MTGQQGGSGTNPGPGNRLIATTLLEWLAVRGRSAARDRAERALALGRGGLAEAPAWLSEEALAAMFGAAEVDRALARSIGHRLVAPDATGLRLYGLGLATPEKAYRRLQSLVPRAEPDGRWLTEEIKDRCARIRFENAGPRSADRSPSARVEASFCALRRGLLEAIPGLYGLLPAEVEESTCRARGDEVCCYEVRWKAARPVKTLVGAGVGLAFSLCLAALTIWPGVEPLVAINSIGASIVLGLSAIAVGLMSGRVFDLQDQLEAVAGARRGHLALFDQVDEALAEKLDALARVDASLETEERGGARGPSVRLPRSEADDSGRVSQEERTSILAAAQEIHAAAGDLECWFEKEPPPEAGAAVSPERGRVREIREWAARILENGAEEGAEARVSVDLTRLVRRAIATLGPSLPIAALIKIDAQESLRAIECEPVQIECVVVQLLRNAVEACVELTEAPEVVVTLRNVPRGVELAVEDRGVGIDSTEVDEVFDPFFGEEPVGASGGPGLNGCLRIIERHGGEMRIEAEARAGTRVTLLLPGPTGEGVTHDEN